MKQYNEMTNEEKIEFHNVVVHYLEDELEELQGDYEGMTNLGERYETLIKINYVRSLIALEKDMRSFVK